MIETFRVDLPQRTGQQDRNAYVYVPDGLAPGQRCPVLYMFDGHNVFYDSHATYGRSWRLGQWLDGHGARLIVAAVECDHSPEGGRLSEYSPYSFTQAPFGSVEGRGRETMEWFVRAFKPEVDLRWPTLPGREHTMIAGSSMGGLMSLYAVLEYNRVFSRAAALSPSLWVAPERLEQLVRTAPLGPGTGVYLDCGEGELEGRPAAQEAFWRTAGLLAGRGVRVTARTVPGGAHCEESWGAQAPFFLGALLYGTDALEL